VIGGNDASVVDGTVVYFMNELDAALDDGLLTTAKIVDPNYYVVVTGNFQITSVTSVNDEIPVDDRYERGVVDAWLKYCAERELDPVAAEQVLYNPFIRAFNTASAAGSGRGRGPEVGRSLSGFSARRLR
jgi:hypothetical protein